MYMIRCDRCGNYEETNAPGLLYIADKKNDHEYSIVRFTKDVPKQITLCKGCEELFTKFLKNIPEGVGHIV